MKFNKKYNLIEIVEKPKTSKIQNYKDTLQKIRVSMNIFLFEGQYFYKYLKSCAPNPDRNEKELPTALMNMINDGISVKGIPIAEHVPDLTSKKDIFELDRYLKDL